MKDPKWLIIIGLIIWIVLLRECGTKPVGGVIDEVTTVHTDTLHVTHIDTIPFIDTIIRTVTVKINEPVKVVIEDDVWDELNIQEYTNTYTDSLLDGTIWTRVDGELLDQKLTYTPKFPKYIFQVDTVIIDTKQTTLQTIAPKFSLNIGAEVGGKKDEFNFSPMIGFSSKNGISYSYRYGILNKTHNIGVMYNFKIK
tara:strand:- start:1345 stop:1935 length:591 start_codon:yes stop_codon:yes gene_type:complete